MRMFLQRFGGIVSGLLHGFDRLRLRGSKRLLCNPRGILRYFSCHSIRLTDYKNHWAKATTDALCRAIETQAEQVGDYRYLNNLHASKEQTALEMAAAHGRTEGRIAVLGCVEPCHIVQARNNKDTGRLEPRLETGRCLHYYHYYLDPRYGLRYTRLQSWFPFTMHIGLNGRDWLARQLTAAGLGFTRQDNCFTWVEDWAAAQGLLDEQLTTPWATLLDGWAEESHPWLADLLPSPVPYYWSAQEAEYATDIAFARPEDLQRIYPWFVRHAVMGMSGTDVLRYMGYPVRKDGRPPLTMPGEVTSTIKELLQGTRVRHCHRGNLLKMYDKAGQVLRLENLLMTLTDFRAYRTRENDPDGPREYLRLRKGVADLHRRAEVGEKINGRYADALASVKDTTPVEEVTKGLAERVSWHGRPARALNPLGEEDGALLEAVSRGEFAINGFRNRDLRVLLYPGEASAAEVRRQSGRVTRLLRLLRAHGVIGKVSKTHRYQVTAAGRVQLTALLALRRASVESLTQAA